jgi:hypothetical protein
MWQILMAVIFTKIIYNRGKKILIKYKSLKELKIYGQSVKCPYIHGEDLDSYRKRLIEIRNKQFISK